jgi:hypothetical protein
MTRSRDFSGLSLRTIGAFDVLTKMISAGTASPSSKVSYGMRMNMEDFLSLAEAQASNGRISRARGGFRG